ncbi:MAG: hypothetical protein Q8O22_02895 [Candidatus Omnitrophota bacterium]|nr:hypothetical protein [Candidatus Omnitrophota bacterium]
MHFKMLGLFAMAHAVVLLTISFFVLFSVRKLEKEQGLKVFGYTVAALLWLAVLVVFSAGACKVLGSGKCGKDMMMKRPMQCMAKGMMQGAPQMPSEKSALEETDR